MTLLIHKDKYTRSKDNITEIAVILSRDRGVPWTCYQFSAKLQEEMVFNSHIAKSIHKDQNIADLQTAIRKHYPEMLEDHPDWPGTALDISKLYIEWVPINIQFFIIMQEGIEILIEKDSMQWFMA